MVSDHDRSRRAPSRIHISLNLFCLFLKRIEIETFGSIAIIWRIIWLKFLKISADTWSGIYISFDWFNFSFFNSNIWPDFGWFWFYIIYSSLKVKVRSSNLTNNKLFCTWICLFSSCSFSKFVSIFICAKISSTSGTFSDFTSTSGSLSGWFSGTSGGTLWTSGFTNDCGFDEENESLNMNWANWYPI